MSISWKDVAGKVAKVAPMLGTLLGGPAGGAIGAVIASTLGVENEPGAVEQALQINPDAAVKLREIESSERVKLQEFTMLHATAELNAAAANADSINKTMQAEANAERWPTYSWRPAIGFAVGLNVVASSALTLAVFVPVMFGNTEAAAALGHLPMVLGALAGINATVLPILGVASWFRGKMQTDPSIPPALALPFGAKP